MNSLCSILGLVVDRTFSIPRLLVRQSRTITQKYRYQPLDPVSSEIRLLRLEPGEENAEIHCSLSHAFLDDKPEYQALSYMWGDATIQRQVFLSGYPHSVTENLEIALRHLRAVDHARILWIDALCIDQSNLIERGEQVQKMKHIYNQASSVLAWVGDEAHGSYEAMEILEELDEAVGEIFDEGEEITPDNLEARGFKVNEKNWLPVYQLLDRPYWTRCWIIQEIIRTGSDRRARDSVVRIGCGGKWASVSILERFVFLMVARANFVLVSQPYEPFLTVSSKGGPPSACALISLMVGCDNEGGTTNLTTLLTSTRHCSCTDPRDRVYSLLGLCDDEDRKILPDYMKSIHELRHDVITHLFASNLNLDILPSDSVRGREPEMSCSWSFDSCSTSMYTMWRGQVTHLRASGDSSPKFHFSGNFHRLSLRGFSISTVKTAHRFEDPPADDLSKNKLVENVIQVWLSWVDRFNEWATMTKSREAVWRTIITDGDHSALDGNPVTPAPDAFRSMAGYIFTKDIATEFHIVPPEFQPSLPIHIRYSNYNLPFTSSMTMVLADRSIFVTTDGRIGVGPNGMEPGDIVCILFGGKYLYVLREAGEEYLYIGNAYIYGATMGEMMEPEVRARYKEKDFVLV